MLVVLIVDSGASWASRALTLLGDHPGIVVLKRCVDVDDLLAAATAGQADAAVLGLESPGLDAVAVDHLRRHGVRPVAVVSGDASFDTGRLRASRIGIRSLLGDHEIARLPAVLTSPEESWEQAPPPVAPDQAPADPVSPGGRVVAVWGPAGAPGRTTVATGLAAELARRGRRTVLVDADPYGGSVAQQLGILDEVSGLLAAARLAAAGALAERFGSVQRGLGQHLSVVTGLPRADRWAEVRGGAVEHLLEVARDHGDVVVDTGFCLEGDGVGDHGARPGRNALTLGALGVADEVVVVGSADPVGLSRLARAVVELEALLPGTPVRVVVNRMRSTLGWSERDVAAMVAGFGRPVGLHFLPDDQAAVDRALVAGRTLTEGGDSALSRAIGSLVDALAPAPAPSAPPVPQARRGRSQRRSRRGLGGQAGVALSRRTAGTAHPR